MMKFDRLKKILITACCFFLPLCSGIQSMDSMTSSYDKEASIKITSIHSYMPTETGIKTDKNAIHVEKEFTKLENANNSWMSYLFSSVKTVIGLSYDVVDFSVKHPKLAAILSLYLTTQVVLAKHDPCALYNLYQCYQCSCYCDRGTSRGKTMYVGPRSDIEDCKRSCDAVDKGFYSCRSDQRCAGLSGHGCRDEL